MAVAVGRRLEQDVDRGSRVPDRRIDGEREVSLLDHQVVAGRCDVDVAGLDLFFVVGLPNGKRIPGLKLNHPRQLAVMHALVRFAHIAAGDTFTMRDLHGPTAVALDTTPDQYRLASLRYDLSKLRAKGLVERVPHSRRYRLLPHGYSICLLFLKLFERVYAPLTAGLLQPITADTRLAEEKRHRLDRLYQRIVTDLDALLQAIGLKTAA